MLVYDAAATRATITPARCCRRLMMALLRDASAAAADASAAVY